MKKMRARKGQPTEGGTAAPAEAAAGVLPVAAVDSAPLEKSAATGEQEALTVPVETGRKRLRFEPGASVLPGPEWEWATVTWLHYPNPGVIQVRRGGGELVAVRIRPDWRDFFRIGMAVGVKKDGRSWMTRRPIRRGWF